MNIYGERYAEVGLFIGYCRELNIVTDERELEYYEKSGVMLPAARVVYPDDCVVERYRRELDGDYNWTGFDVWPELADLAEKFPLLLRRFDDLTDEELVHCFDRALDAGGNPYLHIPSCGSYRPWKEYAVEVTEPYGHKLERQTAEHYYSFWQVHQLYRIQLHPHLYRYANLIQRLPPDDPIRNSLLAFPSKERLREFDGMRPCFDALSFWITLYGRERVRTATGVPDQDGLGRIGTVAADDYDDYRKRLAASASMAMERFQLAGQDLLQFLRQLIALYEDYERNERYKLARKLRYDILHCGRLLELAEDQTLEEVAGRLGQVDPFDRQTFRRLRPPAKERDYAVDLLTHAPATWKQALQKDGETGWLFTESDANALLDFCEKERLSLLRTYLSSMLAIGEDERLDKFGHKQSYDNLKNVLTGYEGLLKKLAPRAGVTDIPNGLTETVSKVMRKSSLSWGKKFDRVRSDNRRLLDSRSTDHFLTNLHTLLNHPELRNSQEGLVAMPFLVTCLARNFTAHLYPDQDAFFGRPLGKIVDATIVAITYTWKLAEGRGSPDSGPTS